MTKKSTADGGISTIPGDLETRGNVIAASFGDDDTKILGRYDDRVKKANEELREIAKESETLCWKHAVLVHYAVQSLEKDYGDHISKEQIYSDLARGHKWAAGTIKKAGLYVKKLYDMGREEVAVSPESGYHQMVAILSSRLPVDTQGELVVKVYKHDKKNPDKPYTVQSVKAMVKELLPPKDEEKKWVQGTDLWSFGDHDPRYGDSGALGRLPGQIYLNLLHRFAPGAGQRVLSVGCGSGTLLDVCKKDMARLVADVRGIDIHLSPALIERHPDQEKKTTSNGSVEQQGCKLVEFDATLPPEQWDEHVCPPEWADVAVISLDAFEFFSSATTVEPTNFGNINDPEEYVEAMARVIRAVGTRLNVNGILAVISKQTAEFENGTPVPNIDFGILSAIHEVTEFFVASPVIKVGTLSPKPSEPHDRFLKPEALRLHIYRKI